MHNLMSIGEKIQIRTKERDFNELNRDFQRKQREYREDVNQRRNEELSQVIDQANRIIRQIAEQEKFDLIFQDAVLCQHAHRHHRQGDQGDDGKPPAK